MFAYRPSTFQLHKQPTVRISKPHQKLSQCCKKITQHKFLKQIFQLLSLRETLRAFSINTHNRKCASLHPPKPVLCILCW